MFVRVQGASCPEPSTVYVDTQALRNDRVTLVEKGSPNSLCLMESGKVSGFVFERCWGCLFKWEKQEI